MNRSAYVHESQRARVVFARGALDRLPAEVERLGAGRALVLSTAEQTDVAQRALAALGSRGAGIFAQAAMHVPLEIARRAREHAVALRADCAIAVGGGSTIGLGKAIALDSGLPIVAVPTTLAGSEMTSIYGLTEDGIKKTGRDPRVLPRTVIYDPEMLLTLPADLALVSGLNAIAHAAEGLYAHDGSPLTDLMAEEGIRAMAGALPGLRSSLEESARLESLSQALYGAWLCGTVLGSVSMGLHHKLCHTLGGAYNLPHAQTHALMLPHTLAYNSESAPGAMARIARALGQRDAAAGVYGLLHAGGAPVALEALGLPANALDHVADLAVQNPYPNPRPLQRTAIRALLQRAYAGMAPSPAAGNP